MTVRSRTERVKEVAEKKTAAAKPATYWMTRDRAPDGTISEEISIWLAKPTRKQGVWSCTVERYSVWTKEVCLKNAYVYPDDEIMCIRNGKEPTP